MSFPLVEVDDDGYEVGPAGFWHRRYDQQHHKVLAMEDEIAKLRAAGRLVKDAGDRVLFRHHDDPGDDECWGELDAALNDLDDALHYGREAA